MADCQWFKSTIAYIDGKKVTMKPFDLSTTDKKKFEKSNFDQRIKAAVLIDPSIAQAFDKESLKNIKIPMIFINLGNPQSIPVAVASKELSKTVAKGTIEYISEAMHYSFLPECKEGAKAFLKKVGEVDPICDEVGSRTRHDIHKELILKIRAAFKSTL